MIPCTPTECLKIASHLAAPPAQCRCIYARMDSAVSFHYWDKNLNSRSLPDLVKSHCLDSVFLQLVSLPNIAMTSWEEDTPLWSVCCERKTKTVVKLWYSTKPKGAITPTICLIWVQILPGRDTLFCFASRLWNLRNDRTGGAYKLKSNLQVKLKCFNLLQQIRDPSSK